MRLKTSRLHNVMGKPAIQSLTSKLIVMMLNAFPDILHSMKLSETNARFYGTSLDQQEAVTHLRYWIGGRLLSADPANAIDIRTSRSGWLQMQRPVECSAWRFGQRVETGGILPELNP